MGFSVHALEIFLQLEAFNHFAKALGCMFMQLWFNTTYQMHNHEWESPDIHVYGLHTSLWNGWGYGSLDIQQRIPYNKHILNGECIHIINTIMLCWM